MAADFAQIHPALAYAARHLDEDVSLAALAAQSGLSPFHLHRMFSAVAGETPKKMTLRLRLGRAAVLLLSTNESVLDVALNCGFQSHEVFCRAFRRRFGMAPGEYRARGFTGGASRSQARDHAAIVNNVAPCVGLYHVDHSADHNFDQKMQKKREERMSYSITKTELAPQPVLLIRRRVKRSDIATTIQEGLGHVFGFAQQHGIALAGLPFTRYSENSLGLVTMEPGMRIAGSAQDPISIDPAWTSSPNEVVRATLPGGPAATTIHVGSYAQLGDAYAAIEQWMEAEGVKNTDTGSPWECYLTDPTEHPDPKDWKTEIFWPLRR